MAKARIVKISELLPDEHNANQGTERGGALLEKSLAQYGAGRSILIDKNNRIIAGNKTHGKAGEIGLDEVIVIETDGKQLVAVKRTDLDIEDEAGRMLAYADNQVSAVDLAFDPEVMQLDLSAGLPIDDFFYASELFALGVLEVEPLNRKQRKRSLPLDAIYTLNGSDATCCLAVRAGLQYGVQSGSHRLCPYCRFGDKAHRVAFVDNDYFKYNHMLHRRDVQKHAPKYATVRDVMTKKQCDEAGIEYYPLEQILTWAEDLEQFAENVIVIPKYDCIADIPERFVLGYSVPSSHGSTPLSLELFADRRIHLLGGSWKAQRDILLQLGDAVVSFDNNHVERIAQYGQYVDEVGKAASISELGVEGVTNPRYIALALSFGAIAASVKSLFEVEEAGTD